MTHDEAAVLLSARLDGPLPSDQQQALDAWLAESPDHSILAEAFQTQHADLRTAFEPRREAAARTATAVARQLVEPPSPAADRGPRRWWHLLVAPLPAACAAAVLVGLGLLVFRGKNTPDSGQNPIVQTSPQDVNELGLKPRARTKAPDSAMLAIHKQLATLAGEKKRVALPDGSFLYLNQNTTVELVADRHIKLEKGEVFVEAAPAKAEGERFTVSTPNTAVTALGTKFAVTAKDAGTGVLVTQGKVEVSGLDQKLTTGQELLPGIDKVASAPRASAALDWTKDLMTAAEAPLVDPGKYSGGSLVAVDPYGQEAKLSLVKYHVDVHVEDGFARTTIDQTYFNSENSRMEGTFYFPLPPDASLSRLAMYVDGDLMEGGMAERDHARDVYERIRYQNRDPALLEWVDGSVFKMRVFPLEARQEKRIILSYTQRLPVLYGRSAYRFPAGHTLAMVDQWSFKAFVKDGARLSAMSPSHPTMKLTPQGQDLVMTDEKKGAKVDRDVVLELADHQAQAAADSFRWSRGELDGQSYLMLRYRPDLPSAPRRERRDWVFLFESSGARDPLVARAQVEVIRALLTHAEHDDTFAVLSVGTRVRQWTDAPQPATPENIDKAIGWLETRHLVGALNLEQAIYDATPLLQAGPNPHLVHVGGGVASIGEQRADELVKRIPPGARYVGIGVGKRVSPAFMKVAAERTGGLFTQVNPDEPIGWRGFEIASTLNAPRLLNVHIDTPGINGVRFLTFTSALAHGEELAAVANVTHAMPRDVAVRGTMDGQPFEKAIPVSNVADGAGYLPRTWAKLEIDRLLAEESQANRPAITELSKAMYVMTPFTSLLVLENEQMYKDFKVDRGRKDHWALYPCPAKIPVVYIPDPNRPAGVKPDLKGQKPHANQVLQTIMVRNPAPFLTWSGHGGGDTPVETAGQRWGTAVAVPVVEFSDMDLDNVDLGLTLARSETSLKQLSEVLGDSDRRSRNLPALGAKFKSRSELGRLRDGLESWEKSVGKVIIQGNTVATDRIIRRNVMSRTPMFRSPQPSSRGVEAFDFEHAWRGDNFFEMAPGQSAGVSGATGRFSTHGSAHEFYLQLGDLQRGTEGKKLGKALFDGGQFAGRQLNEWKLGYMLDGTTNRFQIVDGNDALKQLLGGVPLRAKERDESPHPEGERLSEFRELDGEELTATVVAGTSTAPRYYARPSFNGNSRVFTDLAAYAPGLGSSPADVRAVVEAEAAPRFGSRLGSVDPAARKLIDAARTADWKALRLGGDKGIVFIYDGRGRYAYERRVAFGLLERVVCDGTHLWHLYPEIGLGAKRTVSRFHRAELLDLVPDFVPPADDLAYGADVKAINENTVALVPLRSNKDEGPEEWLEVHLIFAGSRLAERRWVARSEKENEVLAREVYEGSTTRLLVGKDAKEVEKTERKVTSAAAPELEPDVRGLVVLPLPLRSRDHVYYELGMEPGWPLYQDHNACFEYLDEDSAMRLLAAEFAANQGGNVATIWYSCFGSKGDDRTGFFTLMAAAGQNPRSYGQLTRKFEKDPADPLVRYLWELHDENIHDWQARFGFGPGRADGDTFLGKLTSFRRIVSRWNGGYIHNDIWGQRDGERTRVLDFVTRNADNVLGWCALALVQDRCPSAAAWKAVAEAWHVLSEKSALRYPALYEEARCLGNAGLAEPAQQKYQALFQAALQEGVLPPLDSTFRSVLEGGKEDIWAKLMRETAAKCAEKKARPVIVTLAWQCYQLGDTAMADSLLDTALANVPADEKAYTGIAAVQFLNATSRYDRADRIVRDLLGEPKLAKSSALWRLASQIADNRKDSVRGVECLEKALDIEYERIANGPATEVIDLQPIRNDYGRLLSHYEWLADAAGSLRVAVPKDLVARVVKAADRWRHLDPEANDLPNRVAAVLRKAGGESAAELAWDYATTPLAQHPNEAGPWTSLAWTLRQEGNWRLADRCYDLAFAAEPTNAQLLWDRAEHLRQQGQIADSRKLLRQLADSEWQPRFNGLKAQARQAVDGR
jgi:ferric-dicitrate binding protein FerR (iron transport regulator)/tetratricopeptide (TPR) repeat protein